MADETSLLIDLTEQMLAAARQAGAEAADAIAVSGSAIGIDVRKGGLEHAERSEATEIGLRVLLDRRQAIVSGSDLRAETLSTMAERAVAMAKAAPEDAYCGLAEPKQLAKDTDHTALELQDPTAEPEAAVLEQDALAAEDAAQSVEGITQIEAASAGYGRNQIWMQSSNGFSGGYGRSWRSLSCVSIAGTGTEMERDYDGDSRIFQSDLRRPEDIGTSAAARTLARLGPRKPATGRFPVLFDERVSSSLVGHLLAAVNGASIARGSSWLRDGLNTQVLPAGLSIIEDPHRARVGGSRLFDGEGLATGRRAIVDQGVLTGWTLDLASARRLGLQSTANAARGISAPPSPSSWNIELSSGPQSRDALIKDMGTGLLVTSLIGSTINPTTGDYSRGASGLWIENGAISHPVSECTIAGNLREMLRSLTPANDARGYLSRVVPSLLVEGMTIAGA